MKLLRPNLLKQVVNRLLNSLQDSPGQSELIQKNNQEKETMAGIGSMDNKINFMQSQVITVFCHRNSDAGENLKTKELIIALNIHGFAF